MKPNIPYYIEISDIIISVLKNEATSEERSTLDQWLEASEANRLLFDKFSREECLAAKLSEYESIDLQTNVQRFTRRLETRRRLRRTIRYCAAIFIPLLITAGIWFSSDRDVFNRNTNLITGVVNDVKLTLSDGTQIALDQTTEDTYIANDAHVSIKRENGKIVYERQVESTGESPTVGWCTLDVPRGAQCDLVLEDGTRVWLNTDSQLRFPTRFDGGERRVYIQGEASFLVAHDADKPFIVDADGQTLRVLGTEFNISAYRDESVVYTTLLHGSVSLRQTGSDVETMLKPNEQARMVAGIKGFTVSEVNAAIVGAWRTKSFVFEEKTLDQVMRMLSRWYDCDYSFNDPGAETLVLRGEMPYRENIDAVLRLIESSGLVKLNVKGKHITISMEK